MGGSHEFIIPAETPWLCDSTVQRLFAAFLDAGEELYFVGGCVRNAVLGAPVSDIDLSTSALPETTMAIVKAAGFKPVPTGIDHGTITAVRDGQPFEITTFRKDVETDGRRAVVAFSKNLREDALRRDFTMNALYADQTGRVIDPTGGLPDARAGRIRFIENPHDRIREDHLRILRFFRFSAWYGNADLGFDADVLAAIADLSDGVLDLSKERVGQEMLKLLVAPNPVPAVAAMSQIGVLSKILPGADPQFLGPLVHLEEQSGTQPDPLRRLAALGGMDARENLRLSKSQAANLDALTTGQGAGLTDKGLGHVYGAETGWSILLLLGAVMSVPVDPHRRAEVAAGATLKFPIRASDLPDHLEGRQIGDTLKKLKADWLASDLNADKSDLLG